MSSALLTGCICSSVRKLGDVLYKSKSKSGREFINDWMSSALKLTRKCWAKPRKIRIFRCSVWDSKWLSSKQWLKKALTPCHSAQCCCTYQEEQESSFTVPVASVTTLGTRQMRLCVSAHKWQQSCCNDDTCCMQRDVWNTNFLGWRNCWFTNCVSRRLV